MPGTSKYPLCLDMFSGQIQSENHHQIQSIIYELMVEGLLDHSVKSNKTVFSNTTD